MPKLLEVKQCPHCAADLGSPSDRVCPSCGGSLQQRHLRAGCFHTGPAILLFTIVLVRALDRFL